jgi:hypothetical protein
LYATKLKRFFFPLESSDNSKSIDVLEFFRFGGWIEIAVSPSSWKSMFWRRPAGHCVFRFGSFMDWSFLKQYIGPVVIA